MRVFERAEKGREMNIFKSSYTVTRGESRRRVKGGQTSKKRVSGFVNMKELAVLQRSTFHWRKEQAGFLPLSMYGTNCLCF